MLTFTPLTKLDITALRKADDVCVHLNLDHPAGLVRAIKRADRQRDPFAQNAEHHVTAESCLDGYRCREAFLAGRIKCFASVTLYRDSNAASIFRTLRAGDAVVFRFYPDGECNGYAAAAHLHADQLYLDVYRNGKRVSTWLLDVLIAPENSARMCSGVPYSEYLQKAADRRAAYDAA